jgi:hypothetical protein
MATRKLYDPATNTSFQRHKYSGIAVPDGRQPMSESKAAELLTRWLQGEIQIDFSLLGLPRSQSSGR